MFDLQHYAPSHLSSAIQHTTLRMPSNLTHPFYPHSPFPSLPHRNHLPPQTATNHTALITGASAGIGASTALLFSRAGTNVVLVARRADKLAEVKAKCLEALKTSPAGEKGRVVVIEADMQERKSLDGVVGKLEGLEVDL